MTTELAVYTGTSEGLSTKYHNRQLFNYSGPDVDRCLDRLAEQGSIYWTTPTIRRKMRLRALFTAAMTLNATAVWTAKLLVRGTFSMSTQSIFFRRRFRMYPAEWGANAKSCFARALSGYSLGADGVCIDRHLERLGLAPKDAPEQWAHWFRLYESMYGPGETVLCVRWHVELLDWIAGRRGTPVPWK